MTTFSQDIGMSFGEDRCGYVLINRGKLKQQGEPMVINGVTIKELKDIELIDSMTVMLTSKKFWKNTTDELKQSRDLN